VNIHGKYIVVENVSNQLKVIVWIVYSHFINSLRVELHNYLPHVLKFVTSALFRRHIAIRLLSKGTVFL
jgi:hypothetical protein